MQVEFWDPRLYEPTPGKIARDRLNFLSTLAPEPLAREIVRGEIVTRLEIVNPRKLFRDPLYNSDHAEKYGRKIYAEGQTHNLHGAATLDTHRSLVREVTDGIHRSNGVIIVADEKNIEALFLRLEMIYGQTSEQILLDKIAATTELTGVKTARIAIWMKKGWEKTIFAKKISLKQAFGIVHNDKETSYLLRNPTDRETVKGWVRKMAGAWEKKADSIYHYLLIVDITSPYLLARIRQAAFTEGSLALTFPQVKLIAEGFPGQFPIQEEVARHAHGNSIPTRGIEYLVSKLRGRHPSNKDIADVVQKWKQETGGSKVIPGRISLIRETRILKGKLRSTNLSEQDQERVADQLKVVDLIAMGRPVPAHLASPNSPKQIKEVKLDRKIVDLVTAVFDGSPKKSKTALAEFLTMNLGELTPGQVRELFDRIREEHRHFPFRGPTEVAIAARKALPLIDSSRACATLRLTNGNRWLPLS